MKNHKNHAQFTRPSPLNVAVPGVPVLLIFWLLLWLVACHTRIYPSLAYQIERVFSSSLRLALARGVPCQERMITMMQPNLYRDFALREAKQRQRQLVQEQRLIPNEPQLTASERATSRHRYLLSIGLTALSVLVLLAVVLFFLVR